jgi:hypothetical protein
MQRVSARIFMPLRDYARSEGIKAAAHWTATDVITYAKTGVVPAR